MKAGWQNKTLGDVFQIERGGSPRPIEKFLTDDPNGINWIKIGDTKDVTKYIYKTNEKIRPEGAKRSRVVNEGDFILSNSMSFGRPYIMKTTGCIHDGWLVLREKMPDVNKDFFYHLLGSDLVYRQFDSLAAGSTVRNLNIELVKKVAIPFPPFPEQQRIAAILDEAFEGIATATANAEKNLKNARELFESTLQSVFTDSGKGWEVVKLSELTTDITDGDHQPPPKAPNGIPFITISNINKATQEIDFSSTFKVSREYYENLKVHRKPRQGDVLYTVTGSFGIPVIVATDLEFCFQRHIGLIRPSVQVDSKWLYYLMMSPQVFKQAADSATGTAQKTVSLNSLRNFLVPRMILAEQQLIVAHLDQLAEQTKKLETIYQQKLTALNELKKSILNQAFTGQLH